MGILSWLFVEAAKETATETYKSAASVTYTVTTAVKDGFYLVADRANSIVANLVPAIVDSQNDLLRQRQEARRLGIGVLTQQLTPEQRFQQQKFFEFKREAKVMIAQLDDEVTDLKESPLSLLFNYKIHTKLTKRDELDALCHANDWKGMQRQAEQALNNKKVIAGRQSRTQAFFTKITKTGFSNSANEEIPAQDQSVTVPRNSRRS